MGSRRICRASRTQCPNQALGSRTRVCTQVRTATQARMQAWARLGRSSNFFNRAKNLCKFQEAPAARSVLDAQRLLARAPATVGLTPPRPPASLSRSRRRPTTSPLTHTPLPCAPGRQAGTAAPNHRASSTLGRGRRPSFEKADGRPEAYSREQPAYDPPARPPNPRPPAHLIGRACEHSCPAREAPARPPSTHPLRRPELLWQ